MAVYFIFFIKSLKVIRAVLTKKIKKFQIDFKINLCKNVALFVVQFETTTAYLFRYSNSVTKLTNKRK